jgi:DNA-binding NarL/FixJ family response regulator
MTLVPSSMVAVLVVDDSVAIRSRLCALLEESPRLRVLGIAGDGVEAIQAFERLRPDAVVLDIQLPGLSGLEVLQRIKGMAPRCVVVMLTNLQHGPYREISHNLGADAFFNKSTEFQLVADFLTETTPNSPSSPRRCEEL